MMMADYNLGTARGRIEIDASGAEKGAQDAERAVEDLGKSASKHSQALQATGTALTGAGLGIATGFGLAVKSASDFETRMSAVEAVAGATSGEIEQLRQKALRDRHRDQGPHHRLL